jgi:acetyl-CoA acyltransferase 2
VTAAQEISLGVASLVLAAGTESMSQAPFAARNIRFGTKLGQSPVLEDTLWASLTDTYCKLPMGQTAEKLATQYNITRAQVDEYALLTQMRCATAQAAGVFEAEIAPVTVGSKKSTELFAKDEHPRPLTTLEGLTKLPPVFSHNGTVTAGNASGIADGAASLILASEAAVAKYNLKPLARLVGYSVAGVDPSIMGIGPVPAIRNLLKVTNLSVGEIDHFEVNEAFGSQVCGWARGRFSFSLSCCLAFVALSRFPLQFLDSFAYARCSTWLWKRT